MGKKIAYLLLFLGVGVTFFFMTHQIDAGAGSQARVTHSACVGNCVVDVYFLHSEMGDSVAKEVYHRWYDTYYKLTSCDASWGSRFSFLMDVIGEIVGAPGAPTLQCWQGVMGQADVCDRACREYFIPDAKYAPNIKLSLLSGGQGHAEVKVDNHANLDALPELSVNAYSRKYRLDAYLQLEDGTPLLIHRQEMASLSFPNWIGRSGYNDCVSSFGIDDRRCSILSAFLIPDEVTASIEFMNGALYDLTRQVVSLNDAEGSFSQDGYVRLLGDGDSLTIRQGDFAGLAWIKTHNTSKDTHTQEVVAWDARQGAVTITNHECNTLFSTCWITGDRTEVDTYVFALQGPAEKMLSGTYRVEVVAEIEHDKNVNDNRVTYAYDASASPGGQSTGGNGGEESGETIRVGDLPVIDLPGAGIYDEVIPEASPGSMFRVFVPTGVKNLTFRVLLLTGQHLNSFVRYGEIPVPDYPTINEDYDCWMQSDSFFADVCPYGNPMTGEYYVGVIGTPGNAFRLEIQWALRTATPVLTVGASPSPQSTPLPSLEVTQFSEVEENNRRQTANSWDARSPFTGRLTRQDVDFIQVSFSQSGSYVFALTPLGAELKPVLRLYHAPEGSLLYTARAQDKGDRVVMRVSALAGEQYYLSANAMDLSATLPPQAYQIELIEFIPDPDEPNNTRAQAANWDLAAEYTGYISRTWFDQDFLRIRFTRSAIYTISAIDEGQTQKLSLVLLSPDGTVMVSTNARAKGEQVNLTFDASAGEEFFLKVSSSGSAFDALNRYRLMVTEEIPDPSEPNDERSQATFWEVSQGPVQGYLWDGIRGNADYYRLVAPRTKDHGSVTFIVSNLPSGVRVRISLLNASGYNLQSTVSSGNTEVVQLSSLLEDNNGYYLRIASIDGKKSTRPYTLSAVYTPVETTPETRTVRFLARAWLRTGLVPLPMEGVEVFYQVGIRPAVLLGTTNWLGGISRQVDVPVGQEVVFWAAKHNYVFIPRQTTWVVPESARSHHVVFYGSEAPVVQSSPVVMPTSATTSTPVPASEKPTPFSSPTAVPVSTPTPSFPARTPPATAYGRIEGHLWRLFPDSEPAGVGGGKLNLSINGIPQSSAGSMIDGAYTIDLPSLQVGDVLRLSASGAEDRFEPEYYEWKAEAGVTRWTYDFYSYWGTITPPDHDDQNHIYGRVIDHEGRGVPGLYILVQMGNSDALQRIGPTDFNGYYEGFVRLPVRMMVTVWVEQEGFVPSRSLFFHAYYPEDRMINFSAAPGEGK